MKTIKQTLLHRLNAQAAEADVQGLETVAESLTTQIIKTAKTVRESDENYKYDREDFDKEINDVMWDAVVRTMDFFDIHTFDATFLQDLVKDTTEDLVKEVCAHAGVNRSVGAHESKMPGEESEKVTLVVDEE